MNLSYSAANQQRLYRSELLGCLNSRYTTYLSGLKQPYGVEEFKQSYGGTDGEHVVEPEVVVQEQSLPYKFSEKLHGHDSSTSSSDSEVVVQEQSLPYKFSEKLHGPDSPTSSSDSEDEKKPEVSEW